MQKRRKNDNRINVIIDPDFKQNIRIKATFEKRTITEVVIDLLEKWLKSK